MKTLGANGMKVLKILHILFGIMWIGGVMALVSIMLGSKPEGAGQIYMAARDHLVIDKWFLIPGGFGIVFTALAYSIFTKWGFFKFRWVTVKWILTVMLVLIGKVYMGVLIERNIDLATALLSGNGSADVFMSNVNHVAAAGIVQLVAFAVILILSVAKPWNKSDNQLSLWGIILLFAGISLHTAGKLLHLRSEDALFYPGVVLFLLGHACYLTIIIRSLLPMKRLQILLVASPVLIAWIPAVAMGQVMPMTIVVTGVMLAISLYISSGAVGLIKRSKGYALIILGGIFFLISDSLTGTASSPLPQMLYVLSQLSFYLAEIAIIGGILYLRPRMRLKETGVMPR